MEAAGNETCSKSMKGATQVALTEEGSCASKSECSTEAKAECSSEAKAECATEAKAECSSEAKAECSTEAKSECSSKEAPAAVKTGAVAEPVKEEVPPCCASKKADPSS
jgi:hypothetical protein